MNDLPRICPLCQGRYAATAGPAFCPKDGAYLVRLDELEDAEDDPLLGRRIGEFALSGRIGKGGMGSVYRAIQVGVDRVVALKILHPEMVGNAEVVQRFFVEARATALLQHRNLVVTYTTGSTPDGLHYIAMEYVPGGSLAQLIAGSWQRHGQGERYTLPPERAVRLFWQIVSALSHAHRAGIVHRDLKPDNVLLQNDPDDGEVAKVVDFGIAKILGDRGRSVTSDGMVMGTALYMAPELFASSKADPRVDLYAAGLLLYEMLSGLLPHASSRADKDRLPMQLVNRRLSLPLPPPTSPVQALSPTLLRLCQDLLRVDPAERPPSAAEVRERLREVPELGGAALANPSGVIAGLPAQVAAAAGPRDTPRLVVSSDEAPTAKTPAPRRHQEATLMVPSMRTPTPAPRASRAGRDMLMLVSGILLVVLAGFVALFR